MVNEPEPEDEVNQRDGEENLDESRDEFNAFDLSQELMKFDKPLEIETSARDLGEIDHEELHYIVEKLHKFARWQRQKLAKRAGVVSQSFGAQLDIIINNSIRVITHKTPRSNLDAEGPFYPRQPENVIDEDPENLDENAQDIEDMVDKINTQMAERKKNLSRRSISARSNNLGGAAGTSELAKSQISSDKNFSAVDQFRYSKKVLAQMSIKQLGILLSCLMPIV